MSSVLLLVSGGEKYSMDVYICILHVFSVRINMHFITYNVIFIVGTARESVSDNLYKLHLKFHVLYTCIVKELFLFSTKYGIK